MNPEDWEKLKETNQCPKCDLSGADLEGANLRHANLRGGNLLGANLKGVRFCYTTMPDGSVNNSDCD